MSVYNRYQIYQIVLASLPETKSNLKEKNLLLLGVSFVFTLRDELFQKRLDEQKRK